VLHSIVFGEGIVNDAAVVLLGAVNSLTASAAHRTSLQDPSLLLELLLNFLQLFMFSCCLGVTIGLLSALLVRDALRPSARPRPEVRRELHGEVPLQK